MCRSEKSGIFFSLFVGSIYCFHYWSSLPILNLLPVGLFTICVVLVPFSCLFFIIRTLIDWFSFYFSLCYCIRCNFLFVFRSFVPLKMHSQREREKAPHFIWRLDWFWFKVVLQDLTSRMQVNITDVLQIIQ